MLRHISDMLRGLFRTNVQRKEEGLDEVAARLEQKVLALVDNMPTLPATAVRAMALADDPDSKFSDLARLIEGDTAIAAGLIRFANSSLYAGGSPAVKLDQAMVRLGMWRCKNLIVSIGVRSLFRQMTSDTRVQCELLWHHGYVTGSLCQQINWSYRLGFNGEEFSAGLLHDLGRVLILLADPECFARAGAMSFREGPDTLDRERSAIGIDHCALGAWFGEHSKLPEALIETMRFHHEPSRSQKEKRLVALVAAADDMANHLQRGEEVATYRPEHNIGLIYLCADWARRRCERLLEDIPHMMEESLQAAAREHATR